MAATPVPRRPLLSVSSRARCTLARRHRPSLPRTNVPCGADDANDLAVDDAHPAPRDDDALDDAIAELLFVVVALRVAVVDAADRRVPPVDDADALGRVDVRSRPDEHVAPTRRRLAPWRTGPLAGRAGLGSSRRMWPKYGLAWSTVPTEAPTSLSAERAEVMHLLEERGQVFRLGDRHLVAQAREGARRRAPCPARPTRRAPGAASSARCTVASSLSSSRTMPRALGVVLEPEDGFEADGSGLGVASGHGALTGKRFNGGENGFSRTANAKVTDLGHSPEPRSCTEARTRGCRG